MNLKYKVLIAVAQKLGDAVKKSEEIFSLVGTRITLSMGVSRLQSVDSQDGLIQRVDTALYDAKNSGKDQVILL